MLNIVARMLLRPVKWESVERSSVTLYKIIFYSFYDDAENICFVYEKLTIVCLWNFTEKSTQFGFDSQFESDCFLKSVVIVCVYIYLNSIVWIGT